MAIWTQKPENHHDGVPVSQPIWQKRLFLPAIPKKNHFGQNTQLWVGFAKIKSFQSQNTQFLAAFEKKMTPLGTKQKIHQCILKEVLSPFLVLF